MQVIHADMIAEARARVAQADKPDLLVFLEDFDKELTALDEKVYTNDTGLNRLKKKVRAWLDGWYLEAHGEMEAQKCISQGKSAMEGEMKEGDMGVDKEVGDGGVVLEKRSDEEVDEGGVVLKQTDKEVEEGGVVLGKQTDKNEKTEI
jgi:hypothetical protein